MKIIIIYDSAYGNTEEIAKAIGRTLKDKAEVSISKVGNINPENAGEADLLIIGSPTRIFSPTRAIVDFIRAIPESTLQGVKIATFDTRFSFRDVRSRLMYNLMIMFGYAARPLTRKLVRKGARCIIKPEGFYVEGYRGPLKYDEVERASNWAEEVLEAYKKFEMK